MNAECSERAVSKPWNQLGILVMGDWLVDEHWATGVHRSRKASRTGRAHYRCLHKPGSAVQSFCGAGRAASVLHHAQMGDYPFYKVHGIGIWHEDDTALLEQMLDPSTHAGNTPFHIKREVSPGTQPGRLFTLSELSALRDEEHGTEHITRIYQQRGPDIEVMQRIDWILTPTRNETPVSEWISDKNELDASESLKAFVDAETIKAVVIKDLGRGVVSKALIEWLAGKLSGRPWFVSTKEWKPDWLEALPPEDLRLLLIPQVPSQTAIRDDDLSCWLTKSGRASKMALQTLDDLHIEYFTKKEGPCGDSWIVVLPSGCSILARQQRSGQPPEGWIQKEVEPGRIDVPVPMASVFLPALVAEYLNAEKKGLVDQRILLERSLAFTQRWMKYEAKRIKDPEDWDAAREEVLDPTRQIAESNTGTWESVDWEVELRDWENAHGNDVTIATIAKKIELWRVMTDLDGFVCHVPSKRNVVRKIIATFNRFTHDEPSEHVSCMLLSEPGEGKTFLARRLAASLGMRCLRFNIRQMLSKDNLIKCFDTIATSARSARERTLVFVDEINATIANEQVYAAFLAPLDEKIFIQDGRSHPMPPCAWLFAGTTLPSNGPSDSKGKDFETRLTQKPEILGVSRGEENEARLENVYLGMALLQSAFPDVREVSEKIVKMFYSFTPALVTPPVPPATPAPSAPSAQPGVRVRDLERFVRLFKEVQYGRVLKRNVPWEDALEDMPGIVQATWDNEPDGPMVRIMP